MICFFYCFSNCCNMGFYVISSYSDVIKGFRKLVTIYNEEKG